MNQSHPGPAPDRLEDVAGGGVERVETPETEVQAKGEAQAATAAAVREAGDVAEGDLRAMTEHVMDKADLEAGTCFGVPVPEDMLPVEVARLLCQLKAEKGLPIENLPDTMVGPLLAGEIGAIDDETEADHTKEARDNFADWREQFATNAEAVLAADTFETGGNPKLEAVKQRLLGFRRILTAVQQVGNEADTAIVTARMARIDLTNPPEPVSFARAFLFDSPNSDEGSGLSDAAQAAIAAELGIERPELDVDTGTDMTNVFEKGVGTRTVRDPETGEERDEPIYLQPGEFAKIRDNQSIGLTENGERAMKFGTEVGGFITPLPDNATAEDMVQYGLAGQMMSKLHEVNMAEIFYPGRSLFERGGGVLEIRMPDDFNRTQQLCQIFYDSFAGYDGALLAQPDLDRIPYLMQFHSRKGDYVIGDINPDMMMADYRAQGVVDEDGNLDLRRFEELVMANRANLYTEANFAQQGLEDAA